MPRPVISLDLDDSLNHFIERYIPAVNRVSGTAYELADIHDADFSRCCDASGRRTSPELSREALRSMVVSGEVLEVRPKAEAAAVLRGLRALGFEILINTLRRYEFLPEEHNELLARQTARWLDLHFAGLVDRIEIAGYERSKAEICRRHRAAVHLDDHVSHLRRIAEERVPTAPVLLATSWNHGAQEGLADFDGAQVAAIRRVSSLERFVEVLRCAASPPRAPRGDARRG